MIIEIMDPIYGLLKINDIERDIVDTPEFQRLRRIKQLSSAFLVYPAANHTRFEHSLGAMHMAAVIGAELKDKGYIGDDDVQLLRIGGLLHDAGHGPFSHLFEDIISKKYGSNHEDITQRVIAETSIGESLKKHGYDPREISELARGMGKYKPFMRAVIAGPLSADLMDYIQRDSYYTGALFGRVNVNKIIDSMHVYEDQLSIEKDAVSAFEGMTIARYEMFKEVYFHKTARGADSMLMRAIDIADSVLGFADPKDLSAYLQLTDDFLIQKILMSEQNEIEPAKELVRDYLSRRLVKLVYEASFIGRDAFFEKLLNHQNLRNQLASEIEERAGAKQGSVFIDLPTVPSVPKTFQREELRDIYLISKGETVTAKGLSINDLPVLENIMGYYNILRIYSRKDVKQDVEKVVNEMFGEGAYGKISV
ncbi:MAG: HD domain-containing protein [Nitrososphaeria archaeon]